ncbi:right-handed parallel beta-helix repeat-containing protein [Halorubraceae archaeon YAN]|nr:right-handed parallel beta-helix repeat-containing protein [Halorubraceae archaeon YAN]
MTLFDGGGHTFVRNIISMHDEAGVLINPSSNNIFIRNEITENGTVGIELDDGERNTFIDNLLEDNEDGPCSVDGSSEDNRFKGNDPECE